MKLSSRHILSIISLAHILLMAACSEIIESVKEPTQGSLVFGLNIGEVQTATRATESTYSTLKTAAAENSKSYIQLHTYVGSIGSSMSHYFSDELYFDPKRNAWNLESAIIRFLPDGPLNVFAYYATNNAQEGDLSNIIYHPPYDATSYPRLDYTIHQTDAFDQVDLLAAKVEEVNSNHIVIPFKHLLSQVNFGVKGVKDYVIKVSNIRIKNVFGKGSYDFETGQWTHSDDYAEDLHTYPYYFPDRNTKTQSGGSGANYQTSGSSDDSDNIYIYGDGGKFGPGTSANFWYAQKDPSASSFLNKDQTSQSAGNSLMLLPQNIKENISASVEFDFVLTRNDKVVASKTGEVIPLKDYANWKPNLRYVYLFDFSNYVHEIKFEVLVKPWENWDSDGINNGIKNATIQEPTESRLNQMGNNDAIYLDGLLERNVVWDWSSYTLTSFNTLTLDFTSVEFNGYTIDLHLPVGFSTKDLANPISSDGRIKIVRDQPIVTEPTETQLNRMVSGRYLTVDGALFQSQTWDWRTVAFERLVEQKSFTIKFTDVDFRSNTIQILLPRGFTASVNTVSSPQELVITNNKPSLIQEPSATVLNALSDGNEVELCCGSVISNSVWDWSNVRFDNLKIQEQFALVFSNVNFFSPLTLKLPEGYVSLPSTSVTSNGKIYIRNNRIQWPHTIELNALTPDQTLTMSGGEIYANEELDWSAVQFSNIAGNQSFSLDLSALSFGSNILKLRLPSIFSVSGEGVTGTNPYFISKASLLTLKNNSIPIYNSQPTAAQFATLQPGQTMMLSGTINALTQWDWTKIVTPNINPGQSFTVDFTRVVFAGGGYIYLVNTNIPYILSGNFGNTWAITITTAGKVTFTQKFQAPTVAELNALTPGSTYTVNGTLQNNETWDWSGIPLTALGASGNTFTLNFTGVTFGANKITITLPAGCIATGSVTLVSGTTYTVNSAGTVTVRDNSVRIPSVAGVLPGVTSLTHGQTIIFSGGTGNINYNFGNTPLSIKNPGEYIRIDFTRNAFTYMEIWNSSFFAGYTVTTYPNLIGLSNENVFTLGGGCVVTITKN